MAAPIKTQGAGAPTNGDLRPNGPSSDLIPSDPQIRRFNYLNDLIFHGVPDVARAYVSLAEHLPLLREMQALLSQRPHGGKTVRLATPIVSGDQLPTWTEWVTDYAKRINYSVRHIRRVVTNEPRTKMVKECGWSVTDHNKMIRGFTAACDLVRAMDAGGRSDRTETGNRGTHEQRTRGPAGSCL